MLSVNSLKRICRKFGIPKWPYRQVIKLDFSDDHQNSNDPTQRFALQKLRQKLHHAIETGSTEDLATLRAHYDQITALLNELEERGKTSQAHMFSSFEQDIDSFPQSDTAEENTACTTMGGGEQQAISGFGKRTYASSSTSLSSCTEDAANQPLKMARTDTFEKVKLGEEDSSALPPVSYSSLELLAQIATQRSADALDETERSSEASSDHRLAQSHTMSGIPAAPPASRLA